MIDASKHFATRKYLFWEDGGEDVVAPVEDRVASRWYVRTAVRLPEGLFAQAQPLHHDGQSTDYACLTQALTRRQVESMLDERGVEPLGLMRVLE